MRQRETTVDSSLNQQVAGRFYVGTDGGFTAQQYTDMIATALFMSAKHAPQPLKTQLLEWKLQAVNIIYQHVAEAMMDERRRVGREYELKEKNKRGRLMLPGALRNHLDEGGIWEEAKALTTCKETK
jgi:hypothetical protein